VDSRERTLLALQHQEPDRIPIDFWASRGTKRKIETELGISYEEFLDLHDVDFRYIEGPRYTGPELAREGTSTEGNSLEVDIWGVPRQSIQVQLKDGTAEYAEVYKEVWRSPLESFETSEQILEYGHWPSADWFDYGAIEAQCEEVRRSGRVVVFMGDRLNRIAQLKPAMYMRGMEQIYIDMVERPEMVKAIFHRISSFYVEYGRRILEEANGKIDILCTGDDFGSQNGLLISPEMWHAFLKDGFQSYVNLGKDHGVYVMHHTCGSIYELIPDMIECGLDILQSLQPEAAAMEPGRLKEEFGSELCFQGGVSIQNILPRGKAEDIRRHVRSLFEKMAFGGGYIACTSHNIQADTPLSSIEILLQAYKEFGDYSKPSPSITEESDTEGE
jgi:uroporphyrinogen decarboxylase